MSARVVLSIGLIASTLAIANEVGRPIAHDSRVQSVDYRTDDVVKVVAAKGVALLVVLSESERIKEHAAGVASDCDVAKGAEWCIIAREGEHLIWVKPLSRARPTDLHVVTDKRIYSFELDPVAEPLIAIAAPVYRLVFRYPDDEVQARLLENQASVESAREKMQDSLGKLPPRMQPQLNMLMPNGPSTSAIDGIDMPHVFNRLNTKYELGVNKGSGDIAPSEVFDDGRFEYLRFGEGKSVPAIFAVGTDGKESQVNKFWKQGTEYAVLTRLYSHIVLRKDSMAVGIWNRQYKGAGANAVGQSTDPDQYVEVK